MSQFQGLSPRLRIHPAESSMTYFQVLEKKTYFADSLVSREFLFFGGHCWQMARVSLL